jgi:hypothetical protein
MAAPTVKQHGVFDAIEVSESDEFPIGGGQRRV